MSMTIGTCTVDEDGVVTKSGAAGEAYDSLVASLLADIAFTIPSGADGAPIKRGLAMQARAIATAAAHVLANGQAKVATTDTGLQRTPDPNNAATATTGPASDKFLGLV